MLLKLCIWFGNLFNFFMFSSEHDYGFVQNCEIDVSPAATALPIMATYYKQRWQ